MNDFWKKVSIKRGFSIFPKKWEKVFRKAVKALVRLDPASEISSFHSSGKNDNGRKEEIRNLLGTTRTFLYAMNIWYLFFDYRPLV